MQSGANRYVSLLSNTVIFAVGNFTVKIISFILMPLYTSMMTEAQYGIGELMNNSIEILLPLVTLGIIESVYRFSIDDDADLCSVFTVSAIFVLAGDILVAAGCLLCASILGLPNMIELCLLFVTSSFYRVVTQFARGLGQAKRFALYGVVNSIILVTSNCILLGIYHMGITGYMVSFSIGYGISGLIASIASGVFRYFRPSQVNFCIIRGMLKYSLPLVPNLVSWWVTNTSSRYIILAFSGSAAAGLYAAASKLPSMLNMFTSIFQQAWQYSTAKEIGSEGSRQFFSSVLRVYSWFCAVVACFLLLINRPLCDLLLRDGFNDAWHLVPLLLLAAAFGCLSAFFGTFYQALKANKNLMVSTVAGALLCVLVTVALVPLVGNFGASCAAALSYFIILLMRIVDIRNKVKINVQMKRIALQYGTISFFAVLSSFMSGIEVVILGLVSLAIVVLSDLPALSKSKSLIGSQLRERFGSMRLQSKDEGKENE